MAWFHIHRHLQNAFIPHEGNNFHPHAVRHHMLGAYAVTVILVKVLTIAFVSLSTQPARLSDVTPTNIIRLTNNERRAIKIPVLKSNSSLAKAAQAKAQDMLRAQYFAHISPTNVTPWYWFKQAGYSYRYAGENLAIDFVESEDVVKAWMNSPSHRKNLLSTKYKEIGVSVVTGNFQGSQSILVVQMFGAPTPKPVQKLAQAAPQTPTPAVAKQELAASAPNVLASESGPFPDVEPERPRPVPPPTPTVTTPNADSIVRTSRPEVVGVSEAGSTVELILDDRIIATAVANEDGIYSVSPQEPLPDGEHALAVDAVARGLTSTTSLVRTVRIDTAAPVIRTDESFALFSLASPDTYDIRIVTSEDAAGVRCSCGASTSQLTKHEGGYQGQIVVDPNSPSSSILSLSIQDMAGNETNLVLADTTLYTAPVVAATTGPVFSALRALSYSRTVLWIFLVGVLIITLMSIFIRLEHQHHPTIIASLLVMYLTGALLLL